MFVTGREARFGGGGKPHRIIKSSRSPSSRADDWGERVGKDRR
jgi:hypothetical protein